MLEDWERKYGSLASLHQKVLISKCASPELMDHYVLWDNLSKGADFRDIIEVETPEVFEVLSPRRAELLAYLMIR